MAVPEISWADLSDSDVKKLLHLVVEEDRRRSVPRQMEEIARETLTTQGQEPGGEWVEPAEATTAYPRGWVVSHGGKRWESVVPFNTTTPGQDARWWRDVSDEPVPEPVEQSYSPWTPDTAVTQGQEITYEGARYQAVQAHTTQVGWEPPNVPALWRHIASGTTSPNTSPTARK